MTLTEKVTLSSPYFLFEFTSDITNSRVVFLASDLSNYNDRYNQFLITETSGTTDFTSGTIEMNPTGTWTYRVFEQTSSSNLDTNLVDNKVPLEIGIVKVKGTETTYDTNSDIDNTFIVNE